MKKITLKPEMTLKSGIDLSYAIKSIYESGQFTIGIHPEYKYQEIFENNPFITKLNDSEIICFSSLEQLSEQLKIQIDVVHDFVIFMNHYEINNSIIRNIIGRHVPYICATEHHNLQHLVNLFHDIWWIICGKTNFKITGNNAINLSGKTKIREYFNIIYNSFGYIGKQTYIASSVCHNPLFNKRMIINAEDIKVTETIDEHYANLYYEPKF